MLAYLMLVALGACAASLVWFALLPALARRIERLARRRIEAVLPMSVAEFAGERDQLRAALAVRETLIEKRAEALSSEHANMLAGMGRRDALIDDLGDRLAEEIARHGDTATELNRINTILADISAELLGERQEHGGTREGLSSIEGAHRALLKSHEALVDAADQMRAECEALRAERETLLGRIEGHEAAQRNLRVEHEALGRTAQARGEEIATLTAQRDALGGRVTRMERELAEHEKRLAELNDTSRQRDARLTEAGVRTSETAMRLAASDSHGRALARELAEARGRFDTLSGFHQELTRRHAAVTVERDARDAQLADLHGELAAREARLSELGAALAEMKSLNDEVRGQVSETAARLVASEARAGALEREGAAARERIEALDAAHRDLTQLHAMAVAERDAKSERLARFERDMDAASQTDGAAEARIAETAMRLAASEALGQRRTLELDEAKEHLARLAASQEDDVAALRRNLEEARGERESLQAEIARLVSRLAEGATGGARGREDLVAMIEHLADDIAEASGVTLPAIGARPRSPAPQARTAAE